MEGEAWSAWLVHEENGKIAAWWTIGYDDKEGHLQAALMVKKEHQNKKVTTGIWQFTVQYLIPILASQGAVVKMKDGKTQADLRKVDLYALAHPLHEVMSDSLTKAGFEIVGNEYDKDFENKDDDRNMVHDGSRNRWKIPLAKILEMSQSFPA